MKNRRLLKKLHSSKVIIAALLVSAVLGFVGARAYTIGRTGGKNSCSSTCVYIHRDGFSQSELAVKVGSFVEFRTADNQTHNLALGSNKDVQAGGDHADAAHDSTAAAHNNADDHSHSHIAGTESGVFGADETWKVQFKQPGTYMIHDHLHPDQSILIVAYAQS